VLTKYSESLPLVSTPGAGGIAPGEASRYLYGAAVVAVVLFMPGGLVRLPAALRARRAARKAAENESSRNMEVPT
jgi:branched-chain amino acid transport system permease protein